MVAIVIEHRSSDNRQIFVVTPMVNLAKLSQLRRQPHLARGRLVTNNNTLYIAPHHKVVLTLLGVCRNTNCRTIVTICKVVGVCGRSEVVSERLTIYVTAIHRVNIAAVWRVGIVLMPRLTFADITYHQIGFAI